MNLKFERMTREYGKEVMDIFNYYIENSFAAYPESKLPYEFYGMFLEMTKNYPAYVIKNGDTEKVIGFCFLRSYNPMSAFRETAEISYFIEKDEVGKGIGKEALRLLEEEAGKAGIKRLLAEISSENDQSIKFHEKNGFQECGRFHQTGKKRGRYFDVVWMEKELI
jgi:L-amino acid N-acyltransferase YncA